ncbi:MAG: hypothetical protein HYV97_18785 [Bdellovibrio sp.]|nr:hypothetical protein [Bdellovibrio sp.]
MKITIRGIPSGPDEKLTFTTVMDGADAVSLFSNQNRQPKIRYRKMDVERIAANAVWSNAPLGPILANYSGKFLINRRKRDISSMTLMGGPESIKIDEGHSVLAILETVKREAEAQLNQLSILVTLSFGQSEGNMWSDLRISELVKMKGDDIVVGIDPSSTVVTTNEHFASTSNTYLLYLPHLATLLKNQPYDSISLFLSQLQATRPEIDQLARPGGLQIKRDYITTQPAFLVGLVKFYASLSTDKLKTIFWEWLKGLELRRECNGNYNNEWIDFIVLNDGTFLQTEIAANKIVFRLTKLFDEYCLLTQASIPSITEGHT